MNAGDSNDKNPETKAEMSGGLRDTALSGRGAGNDHGSPEQMAILRGMTPEQRWNAAHQLYWTMRRHKAAFLQSQHPPTRLSLAAI